MTRRASKAGPPLAITASAAQPSAERTLFAAMDACGRETRASCVSGTASLGDALRDDGGLVVVVALATVVVVVGKVVVVVDGGVVVVVAGGGDPLPDGVPALA